MLHEDEVFKPKRFGTSELIETFKRNDYQNVQMNMQFIVKNMKMKIFCLLVCIWMI